MLKCFGGREPLVRVVCEEMAQEVRSAGLDARLTPLPQTVSKPRDVRSAYGEDTSAVVTYGSSRRMFWYSGRSLIFAQSRSET